MTDTETMTAWRWTSNSTLSPNNWATFEGAGAFDAAKRSLLGWLEATGDSHARRGRHADQLLLRGAQEQHDIANELSGVAEDLNLRTESMGAWAVAVGKYRISLQPIPPPMAAADLALLAARAASVTVTGRLTEITVRLGGVQIPVGLPPQAQHVIDELLLIGRDALTALQADATLHDAFVEIDEHMTAGGERPRGWLPLTCQTCGSADVLDRDPICGDCADEVHPPHPPS